MTEQLATLGDDIPTINVAWNLVKYLSVLCTPVTVKLETQQTLQGTGCSVRNIRRMKGFLPEVITRHTILTGLRIREDIFSFVQRSRATIAKK